MSLLPRTPRLWERLRWGMYETEARTVAEELSKFEKKTGDARSRSDLHAACHLLCVSMSVSVSLT